MKIGGEMLERQALETGRYNDELPVLVRVADGVIQRRQGKYCL
jgi:hypothetical protein